VIELFISQNKGVSFLNINRTLNLEENSVLNYTKLEEFTSLDTSIFNFNSNLEENSNLYITSLDYNAFKSLNIWDFYLNKKDILLEVNGIVNIDENRQSANIANIEHNEKNVSSCFNIQHILNDESKAVFDVKSTINENAPYSKVIQNSKTVLLSNNAKINAQPRLQIYTDELEARHSATTGAINQEQLYYLKSRGISHDKAINMIIESYELEVINTIKHSIVKEFVKEFRGKSYV
jgi:Fe-S cluster assembly protein SufD